MVHLEGTKLYLNNLYMKGLCIKTASNHRGMLTQG